MVGMLHPRWDWQKSQEQIGWKEGYGLNTCHVLIRIQEGLGTHLDKHCIR